MMQTVKKKLVINQKTLAALEKALNEWGDSQKEPYLKGECFSNVSTNLIEEYGYINDDGSLRLCYFVDLLNQAKEIVENMKKNLGEIEPNFIDEIEIPDDKKGMILLTKNDDGKLSIKLPAEVLKN